MGRDRAVEAAAVVESAWGRRPRFGVVLGTGLGGVVDRMQIEATVDYGRLAGWPRCTAPGHAGRLVCGLLGDVPLVAVDGRFHRYEGHDADTLTLPVRLLGELGAQAVLLSNAAGGLNPRLATGDLVVLAGHVNLIGPSAVPSRSARPRTGGPYDPQLRDLALRLARREQIPAWPGSYAAVSGPNYETRAEYRFLRRIGADVVGMSTVPEALAAADLGLPVLALSVVTNVARPDAPRHTTGEEVVAVAAEAAPRLCRLAACVVAEWRAPDVAPAALEAPDDSTLAR